MTHESTPPSPFPTDRRVVFDVSGGDSDGATFDSRDADAAGGAMAGHLWFVSGGGAEGRAFDGRSIAGFDRASRSPVGRADEPYGRGEARRYVVGPRTEDGETIRIRLDDVTRAVTDRGLPAGG